MKTAKISVRPRPMAARPKASGPISRAMTMTESRPMASVPTVSMPDQKSERSGDDMRDGGDL
jgi:hypothetical protein